MIKTDQINPADARGWTLWKWFGWRCEFWVCRKSVGPHCHPGQDVTIMPVWGRATFCRKNPVTGKTQKAQICRRTWGRLFGIPDAWLHWFDMEKPPVAFINFTKGPSPGRNFIRYGK